MPDSIPLSEVPCGKKVHVYNVTGREELHHRLEALGFVAGETIEIVSKAAKTLIVSVKGARFGLADQVADNIHVV